MNDKDELNLNDKELDIYIEALDVAEKTWEKDKKIRKKKKNMKIILYSNHCPVCKGVEMKLKSKNIPYELNTDEEEMKSLGLFSAPVLSVDGDLKIGKQIHDFINSYRG